MKKNIICLLIDLEQCISTWKSDQFSLSALRNFASLTSQNAPSEDSDQTARMRRLI